MTENNRRRDLVGEIVIEQALPKRRFAIIDPDGLVWIWPTEAEVNTQGARCGPHEFGRLVPVGPEMDPHVKARFYEMNSGGGYNLGAMDLRIEPVDATEHRPFLGGLRFTETTTYAGYRTERRPEKAEPIIGEPLDEQSWEAIRIIAAAADGSVPLNVCRAMIRDLVEEGWGPSVDDYEEADAAAPDQQILDQIKDLKTVVTDLVKYVKIPPVVLTPPDLTEGEWRDAMKNQTTLHVMDRSDPDRRGSISISDGRVGIDLPREVFDECLRSAVIEGLVATGGGSEASNSSLFAPIYGEVCDEVVKAFAAAHFETKGQ